MTIQINLEQLLELVSSILAVVWGITLMKDQLKRLGPTVFAIVVALLGIITTMWLIGIEMPPETSKFMWYVVLLIAHFSGFTVSMIGLQGQWSEKN